MSVEEAKAYVVNMKLAERLTEAVNAAIKEMPAKPYAFLVKCCRILSQFSRRRPEPARAPAGGAPLEQRVERARRARVAAARRAARARGGVVPRAPQVCGPPQVGGRRRARDDAGGPDPGARRLLREGAGGAVVHVGGAGAAQVRRVLRDARRAHPLAVVAGRAARRPDAALHQRRDEPVQARLPRPGARRAPPPATHPFAHGGGGARGSDDDEPGGCCRPTADDPSIISPFSAELPRRRRRHHVTHARRAAAPPPPPTRAALARRRTRTAQCRS